MLYISLLSHTDRALQRLALSCLLNYKAPRLLPHVDSLRTLLDDTKWSDELTQLDFAQFDGDERVELGSGLVVVLVVATRVRTSNLSFRCTARSVHTST